MSSQLHVYNDLASLLYRFEKSVNAGSPGIDDIRHRMVLLWLDLTAQEQVEAVKHMAHLDVDPQPEGSGAGGEPIVPRDDAEREIVRQALNGAELRGLDGSATLAAVRMILEHHRRTKDAGPLAGYDCEKHGHLMKLVVPSPVEGWSCEECIGCKTPLFFKAGHFGVHPVTREYLGPVVD